jgi:hypothetical protein
MAFFKVGLAMAMAMAIGAEARADTSTAAVILATQIQSDLKTLMTNNGGAPTDAQIQLLIAADLALSNASLADKKTALQIVQAAALTAGSGLPIGTDVDARVAYATLIAAGNFAPATGGVARGAPAFGSTGLSLGGGGSSYAPRF